MKATTLSILLLLAASPAGHGQTVKETLDDAAAEAQRTVLLNDLKALAADAVRPGAPLMEAAAKAEIADAAWSLDREMAKTLLRDAYELTFPKEGRESNVTQGAGAPPPQMSAAGRARLDVRVRVMTVASRDKKLADELLQLAEERGQKSEGRDIYGLMAQAALDGGDRERAYEFVIKSFEFDPTQGAVTNVINDLARQDRAAADQLVLKYIESLRQLTLTGKDAGAVMTHLSFIQLFDPNSFYDDPNHEVPRPGPAVMRAYVAYVIESLRRMEQQEPGGSKPMRAMLMSVWLPLKQHAPELAGAFLELEALSRTPGREASLPTPDTEKARRERADRLRRAAAESDAPDDHTINSLVGNGDYDRARKAIDKLPDGPRKKQHTEKLNIKQALGLAAKGDIAGASLLAERLDKAASLLQVYPVLIKSCAARKDAGCVSGLGLRAMKQLEKADAAPFAPPAGTPSAFFATGREMDFALQGLAKMAAAVAPFDATLSFEMLDRLVSAANKSEVDTALGRAGYDAAVFKTMAALDETRARQSAEALKDPLRRLTALAAVARWKAETLAKASARR